MSVGIRPEEISNPTDNLEEIVCWIDVCPDYSWPSDDLRFYPIYDLRQNTYSKF